jgi:hypothetical protein
MRPRRGRWKRERGLQERLLEILLAVLLFFLLSEKAAGEYLQISPLMRRGD